MQQATPVHRGVGGMRAAATVALALLALAFALTSCGTSSSTGSNATNAPDALRAALHTLVVASGGPPGAIAIFQHGGVRSVVTAGTAVAGSSVPLGASDHIRVASVSKAFSGATALALVAQGKLKLSDTVGQLLPGQPAAWARVTLAQLLNHTSGVPDFSKSPAFGKAVTASLQTPPPPEQLLGYVSGDPLEFSPGSRYAYSNSDNILVGLMIQAVTGQSYATALEQEVDRPLGLSQTSLPESSALPEPFIHGYVLDPPAKPEDVSTEIAAGWSWASGGVVSTEADANRFVRGYVRGDTTNAATRTAQFRFVAGGHSEPPGPGANAAGLALFRYQTSCGTFYGHTGNTPGYTQFIAASGNGSDSVSILVNSQLSPKTNEKLFAQLRHIFLLGVCAARAG